jgi:hypothetical protein
MWPFATVAEIDSQGVKLGRERFAFADLADACLEGSTLILVTAAGARWRGRVRNAFAVLDRVLSGIGVAHQKGDSVYRMSARITPAEPPRAHRLRRRTTKVGSSDLWIGRTLYR